MNRYLLTVVLATAAFAAATFESANAQTTGPTSTTQGMPNAATPGADMVDGEVRKIDKDAKKITLKHAEIPNLEMPGMTMVFRVKEPAMLDAVKVGDKVKFKAQKTGGQYEVTELQSVK